MKLLCGKTAPRLLEDFLNYDPKVEDLNGRNFLTGLPQIAGNDETYDIELHEESCQHKYALKFEQSFIPPIDTRADNTSAWKVAALCLSCRYHVDLIIDFRGKDNYLNPCPNREYPLHHFVFNASTSNAGRGEETRNTSSVQSHPMNFQFQCTAEHCQAILVIRMRAPHLRDDQLRLLTDTVLLEARKEAAVRTDPARFDEFQTAKPVETLGVLHAYFRDSLDLTRPTSRRRVPVRNRLFMLSFGSDCDKLLEDLGFRYGTGDGDASEEYFWYLPVPASSEALDVDSQRVRLEDMKYELATIIQNWSPKEPLRSKISYEPKQAVRDMQRLLGSLNYDKSPVPRRATDTSDNSYRYYASLGAREDFSDALLVYAYDRQVVCDPGNLPYYFDCLQEIARLRRSEFLEERVMMLASQGHISRSDVEYAYKCLGVDPARGVHLSDEYVVNLFQSRLPDVSSAQEGEMRLALRTLGQARQSEYIRQAATDSIETYAQALAWLGASENMSDDYIIPLLALKTEENPVNKEIGYKAVSLIANARNSQPLRNWLLTGEMGQKQMDLGDAYGSLQIDNRTDILDEDTVDALFGARVAEAPEREEEFRQAVELIRAEMLKHQDGVGGKSFVSTEPQYPLNEWPVGLQNIGNTCYLNSLLQFFFTVLPLRNMVLDIDEHMTDITDDMIKDKKVGGAIIRQYEIERAQAFARELRKIFNRMITAPTSEVTPDRDLARLTILKPSEDVGSPEAVEFEAISRSGESTGLGTVNGFPLQGPVYIPSLNGQKEPRSIADDAGKKEQSLSDDAASDVTLRGDASSGSDQEELGCSRRLEPVSSTDNQVQATSASEIGKPIDIANPSEIHNRNQVDRASPPSRPPPMPPRPTAQQVTNTLNFGQVENIAQQRDVTEVIGNVLYQLECAIVPQRTLPDGEQWDLVKDLFYGRYVWHVLGADEDDQTKEEWFNNIIVNVARGPTDIYSALDDYFDPHDIQTENKIVQRYGVINRLPPILQISISRVMYDRERGTGYKIEHHLQLENILYLDRYVESRQYDEMLELRKISWELKHRLQKLKARKTYLSETQVGVDMPSAVDAASDLIKTINVDTDIEVREDSSEEIQAREIGEESTNTKNSTEQLSSLSKSLHIVASDLRAELSDLEVEIEKINSQLSELFSSNRRIPYRLHAVFIHRGTAAGGHYWVYICDFTSSANLTSPYFSAGYDSQSGIGTWRCYNDSSVTPVTDPEQTIFSEDTTTTTGINRATPNLLIYVREDKKEQIVDAVHRHVAQEVLAEQQLKQQQNQQQQQQASVLRSSSREDCMDTRNETIHIANQDPSLPATDNYDVQKEGRFENRNDAADGFMQIPATDQQSQYLIEKPVESADSPVLGR